MVLEVETPRSRRSSSSSSSGRDSDIDNRHPINGVEEMEIPTEAAPRNALLGISPEILPLTNVSVNSRSSSRLSTHLPDADPAEGYNTNDSGDLNDVGSIPSRSSSSSTIPPSFESMPDIPSEPETDANDLGGLFLKSFEETGVQTPGIAEPQSPLDMSETPTQGTIFGPLPPVVLSPHDFAYLHSSAWVSDGEGSTIAQEILPAFPAAGSSGSGSHHSTTSLLDDSTFPSPPLHPRAVVSPSFSLSSETGGDGEGEGSVNGSWSSGSEKIQRTKPPLGKHVTASEYSLSSLPDFVEPNYDPFDTNQLYVVIQQIGAKELHWTLVTKDKKTDVIYQHFWKLGHEFDTGELKLVQGFSTMLEKPCILTTRGPFIAIFKVPIPSLYPRVNGVVFPQELREALKYGVDAFNKDRAVDFMRSRFDLGALNDVEMNTRFRWSGLALQVIAELAEMWGPVEARAVRESLCQVEDSLKEKIFEAKKGYDEFCGEGNNTPFQWRPVLGRLF